MKIACFAWGSLVWNPKDLPIASDWRSDGPSLPVEFARKSNDGRITLVILDGAVSVPVLWCELKSTSVDEAITALAEREGISTKNKHRLIGCWSRSEPVNSKIAETVGDWCRAKGLDAAVWTALGPKFKEQSDIPSGDQVVSYLKGLSGDQRVLAEEYIRRAPGQIRTAYRDLIEKHLDWR